MHSNDETIRWVTDKLIEVRSTYIADNDWFHFDSVAPGGPPMTIEKYIDAAARAYVHVRSTVVPLLLGDTKLRSDDEMRNAFGISNADAARTAGPPGSAAATSSAVPIAGSSMTIAGSRPPGAPAAAAPGGILDNPKWSPMLNDAFILAGVNKKKQFVFKAVGDDENYFNSIPRPAPAGTDKQAQINAGLPVWQEFFLHRPYLIWSDGKPRVFARELLGLAAFNYKAAPIGAQLSFDCPDPHAHGHRKTFANYLQALNAAKFTKPTSKTVVIETISKFLFGKPEALAPIASGA
jgi:hypothetical protein